MKEFINRNKPVLFISLATVVIFITIIVLSQNTPVNGPSLRKIEDVQLVATHSARKGAQSPKVTLVEFSDFQCPACQSFHPVVTSILEKYKEDLLLVYRHYPLPQHKDAKLAAIASQAAHEQGKFWEMADIMFDNQDKLDKESLISYAEKIGMNTEKFKKDLDDSKFNDQVENDLQTAQKIGLNATPSFILGDTIMEFSNVAQFEEQIVKALDEKGAFYDDRIQNLNPDSSEATMAKKQPVPEEITPSTDVVEIKYTGIGFEPNNLKLKLGQRVSFINATEKEIKLRQLIIKYPHLPNPLTIPPSGSEEVVLTEQDLWTFKEDSIRHYGSIFVATE